MGFVDNISEIMHKGPEAIANAKSLQLNNKSVARGAKDATFQFPCLIADSAPIDMANTVVRTLDQVYATFTQTWLSVNNMFDITIDPTPLSHLRKLHQNVKLEGADELLVRKNQIPAYMEKVYNGEYRLYMNESRDFGILFNVADNPTREMMESHKSLLREYMSDFDLRPIEPTFEAEKALDFANAMVQGQIENARKKELAEKLATTGKSSKAPKLLDRDIKKSNDMTPYGIEVRMIAVNNRKEFVQYVDFVLGIKAILHPVESQDMIENIARALRNKSTLFKLLRWTTGELSLAKDIILNINDMKADAINKRNGKSPFFSTLKRLRSKKVGIRDSTPHRIIPNSTIIITSYEAEQLQQNHAINVKSNTIAKKLINSLFLMAFVILDDATGTVSIFYDGDDTYQTYAIETLERDNALNSNKLSKEIGRMISQ